MNGNKYNSDRAPAAVGLYPHARKVDNLLFLSGVGPRKVGQKDIPGVILKKMEKLKVMTLKFNAALYLKMYGLF